MKKVFRFTALLITFCILTHSLVSAEVSLQYTQTLTDGECIYVVQDSEIYKYNIENGTGSVIFTITSGAEDAIINDATMLDDRYIWFNEYNKYDEIEEDGAYKTNTILKVLDTNDNSVKTVATSERAGYDCISEYGGKVYFALCSYEFDERDLCCADLNGNNVKHVSNNFYGCVIAYDNKIHFLEDDPEYFFGETGEYSPMRRIIQADLDGSNQTIIVDWTDHIVTFDKEGYCYKENESYYRKSYDSQTVTETDLDSISDLYSTLGMGHDLIINFDGTVDTENYYSWTYRNKILYDFSVSEDDSYDSSSVIINSYSNSGMNKIGTVSIDGNVADYLCAANGYLYYVEDSIEYNEYGNLADSIDVIEKISNGEIKKIKLSSLINDYSALGEVDLDFDSAMLDGVTDSDSANALMESVVSGMSSAEIASVKAKDQLAYLAEEAAARAATIEAEDDIVIDQKNTEEALSTVSAVVDSAESIISSSDVGVKSVRNKVRYSTSKSSSVSISKENITADVDVVEAVTPFGSFEFEPASVSELTVDSDGTNKISVSFDKNDTTSKVTVKFPNVTSDGYKAVVDEDGNVIGGKYNPITDELSAKIEESGVFTVVTNEKDFSDIKSQPAEVQAAIKKLASKGIIKGTSETEFSPDSPITRAEIAALIVRILDADDPNADGGFSDVTKENWYFGSAGSSKRENIIAGYEDNTFRGTVVIPKVQITSVTARVLTNRLGYYSASESVLNEFTDADTIASWARSDVALAAYANMVIRRTDGSFEPNMEMTRGDAAVILEKLFDKVW
ncbi:MAG: S-layer homology domain-containing protein [Clostridiales bacterium]|nr:S-layer homology domain-containing protein [Clostridiales bacterium]